jgi:hypothetical protein
MHIIDWSCDIIPQIIFSNGIVLGPLQDSYIISCKHGAATIINTTTLLLTKVFQKYQNIFSSTAIRLELQHLSINHFNQRHISPKTEPHALE